MDDELIEEIQEKETETEKENSETTMENVFHSFYGPVKVKKVLRLHRKKDS